MPFFFYLFPAGNGGLADLVEFSLFHVFEYFSGSADGIFGKAGQVMRKIGASEFTDFRFHLPAITDLVLEIVEANKVDWVSAMALRLSPEA